MRNKITTLNNNCSIKISKEATITTLIFIVLPLYSVPFIIYGMWKRKKWAFTLWAIFIGLLGILFPPVADLYRYTMDYELYKGLDWNTFVIIASIKRDLMLPIISYFIGNLELNFDLYRLLYNFLGYYLLGLIYLDIVNRNINLQKKKVLIYALGFFISFNIAIYCYRYFLSAIFFLYGAYQIVYKKKKYGWIFIVLAVFNHLSYIVQTVALILQRMHFFKFSKRLVIFLFIISFFIDSSIITYIFNQLPSNFVSSYVDYVEGQWAGDYLEEHSWRYKLQLFINNLIIYFCAIIYILQYNKCNKKYSSLPNAMILLATVTTPFVTISLRFLAVAMYFIKVHLLTIYDGSLSFYKYLKIMFWLTMITNLMGLWGYRRQIYISDYHMLLYSSSIHILRHTYDSNWMNENISDDGDMLKVNF